MKGIFILATLMLVVCTIISVQALRDYEPQKTVWSLSYLMARFEYGNFTGNDFWSSVSTALHGVDVAEAKTEELVTSIPVFVYHGIVSEADRFNMTSKTFKDQMFALKQAGYETISVEDFNAFMNGEKELYGKPFLLTFDDGRMDSYYGADPVLRALDYTAVMYVAIESSMPTGDHSSYYISQAQIKKMVDSARWELGSHAIQETGGFVPVDAEETKGNFLSSLQWLSAEERLETEEEYTARLTREVVESQATLEELFGVNVVSFSYPFGDYGQQSHNNINATDSIHSLVSGNYELAFRQVWPEDGEYTFNRPGDDKNYLKRVETPTDWSGEQLLSFLDENKDKALPLTEVFQDDSGWHGTWGEVRVEDGGGLIMEASDTSSGASVFLDGSEMWSDYSYTATFDWTVGSHVSLMAQYKDAKNYTVCTFGEGRVKIERVVDGETTKLTDVRHRYGFSKEGTFGMRMVGTSVQCSAQGEMAAQATTEAGPGGVGLRIWDPEINVAAIHVTNVTINPTK